MLMHSIGLGAERLDILAKRFYRFKRDSVI